MTPDEFDAAQRALDLTIQEMADFLCVDVRNVKRWKRGENDIPRWVGKFLPALVELDDGADVDDFFEMVGLP